MTRVRYSELASDDLYANAEFIARDKPGAAYRWVDTIEAVCFTESLPRSNDVIKYRQDEQANEGDPNRHKADDNPDVWMLG